MATLDRYINEAEMGGSTTDDGFWNWWLDAEPYGILYDGEQYITMGHRLGTSESNGFCCFRNITVPQGATVSNCYIRATTNSSDQTAEVALRITAIDADSSGPPASAAAAEAAERTTAYVDWENIPAWGAAGTDVDTPDISTIIQEIVNRPGWASGNALCILIEHNGASNEQRRSVTAYERPTYTEPILHIEYVTTTASFACKLVIS